MIFLRQKPQLPFGAAQLAAFAITYPSSAMKSVVSPRRTCIKSGRSSWRASFTPGSASGAAGVASWVNSREPRVTSTSTRSPSRWTESVTSCSGSRSATANANALGSVISSPLVRPGSFWGWWFAVVFRHGGFSVFLSQHDSGERVPGIFLDCHCAPVAPWPEGRAIEATSGRWSEARRASPRRSTSDPVTARLRTKM